ncbi:MAG TPA: twin-arginine translocase subunit TatC [Methanosarcinales archaeon]|nr:twin-arginine translocase subunit TatC [Methanosarcinales archaeon]
MNASKDIELPITEHIRELRYRLIVILIEVCVVTIISFLFFSEEIMNAIWKDLLSDVPRVAYAPFEWVIAKLTFSLIFALIIGVPLLIYEILMFMYPGLYPKERKFFFKVVPLSFILFIVGVALAYFIAIPLIFKFLLYNASGVATVKLSIQKTFSIITSLIIGFGLVFQFPLLVIFAIKSEIINYKQLKDQRITVYLLLLGFAMIVAPDLSGISQLLILMVLAILFEFSLFIARYI